MFQIVLAWKSNSAHAAPVLVYLGTDGNERLEAVKRLAGKGFVRAQLFTNPVGVPVQIPESADEIEARQAAAAKAKAEREENERNRKFAQAQKQLEAAQAQLAALGATTADQAPSESAPAPAAKKKNK